MTKSKPADMPEIRDSEGRFIPGKSGNPGGRPKDAPQFRARCREHAAEVLDELMARVRSGEMSAESLIEALRVLADRGGYLAGDKLAAAELSRGRLLLEALASDKVPQGTKERLLADYKAREAEALAEAPPVEEKKVGTE